MMNTKTKNSPEDSPKFPCPKWNKKEQRLNFPGTAQHEEAEESAKEWFSIIGEELKNNARGLTNKKRKERSELYKQLRIFLGSESEW
jgi:hypothetical protein